VNNILFLAAECAPFAKVGGLADVVGTLPSALARIGYSVRVIIPHHGLIEDARFGIERLETFDLNWSGVRTRVKVSAASLDGASVYLLRGGPYFAPGENWVYSLDEGIDIGRFLFFAASALRLTQRIANRHGWRPDVMHIHDWHTAMIAYLLGRVYHADGVLGQMPTVFSIHNMMYQGRGVGWHLDRAGLPAVDNPLLRATGHTDNCLAIGIAYSTLLSTVSPSYAREITTVEGAYGLDSLMHARQSRLTGILNGIDSVRWNPATSSVIAARFDAQSLDRRTDNKRALQAEMGLPIQPDIPLMGTVIRLVDQKGPDILIPALRDVLRSREAQFVLLGAGMPHYEDQVRALQAAFPDRVAIRLGFDEALSERIYAGLDLFLMPSLFEPCGIGQMLAMRYGSLPLVRQVGGLMDTVDSRTGFLFGPFEVGALIQTIHRALDVFHHHPDRWQQMQQHAMARDFSWETSARQYAQLYQQAIDVHHSYI